jgi:hypothetical protein
MFPKLALGFIPVILEFEKKVVINDCEYFLRKTRSLIERGAVKL